MNKLKLKEINAKILDNHREITGFYSEYAKSVGLTFAGLIILFILWEEGKCTQSHIVKKTIFPKQTVNAIIKSFINEGIIVLSEEPSTDRRNKVITLTAEGKKFSDRVMTKIEDAQCKSLDFLGNEKAQLLIDALDKYKDNLKNNIRG